MPQYILLYLGFFRSQHAVSDEKKYQFSDTYFLCQILSIYMLQYIRLYLGFFRSQPAASDEKNYRSRSYIAYSITKPNIGIIYICKQMFTLILSNVKYFQIHNRFTKSYHHRNRNNRPVW